MLPEVYVRSPRATIDKPREYASSVMEGSREGEYLSALSVAATVSATASSSSQNESAEDESMMDSESLCRRMVQARIEASKSHWSELSDGDRSFCGEVAADNMKVFETLQSHPEWGRLFWTFNDGSGGSHGTLVVGEKFAEGGQAELFNAHVTWNDPHVQQYMLENNHEKFALKVFKEGILLRDLQRQWPEGFLNWNGDVFKRASNQLVTTPSILYCNGPLCGTLLEGGRFAFLMIKAREDLQSLIERRMHGREYGCAPFSKEESDAIMYKISLGVLWLHEHDVVHRDLKAANVLYTNEESIHVADYECSIGVVATGYWRAPEILEACMDRTIIRNEELFTKASDVYSYAMICYEILRGKNPFEDEVVTMESVIKGQRPTIPTFVSDWAQQLLQRCWNTNPSVRPSIQEILTIIASNTNMQSIKDTDMVQKRTKVTDVEELQVGCDNPLHTFTRLKSGNFKYVMCLETCNEITIKCGTCEYHHLHLECAILPWFFWYTMHPHRLVMKDAYMMGDVKRRCDGCQLDLGRESWYRCFIEECDFDLHLLCAKYHREISHPLHKEHKLVLSSSFSSTSLKDSNITCESCRVQFIPMEFVYRCEECAFNIHAKCAVPSLQVHRCQVTTYHM